MGGRAGGWVRGQADDGRAGVWTEGQANERNDRRQADGLEGRR